MPGRSVDELSAAFATEQMHLLDSDVLIDILRGHAPAVEWFATLETLPAVPGFVVMELMQDAGNKQRVRDAMRLVEPLEIVWPKQEHCDQALETFETLHLSHGLGLLDALIAACAVGHSATLYTFNAKHYRAVAELDMAQPYAR